MRFLDRVAEIILQQEQELIIILPTRRAGVFLKHAIAKRIDKPIFLPEIKTIEDFFYSLTDLQKADPTDLLFRLYKSHKVSSKIPNQFEEYLTWGQTFLGDCNEIDNNLIDADNFFSNLYADREIRNWNVADELTEMQKEYLSFWKSAKALYQDFTENLLQDGLAYNGLAYRIAIDGLKEHFPTDKKVIFCGFNALNKAEKALFDYVEENQLGTILWDIDEYYLEECDINKAGQYFKEYREQWPNNKSLHEVHHQIGANTEKIQIIQGVNNASQCEIVSQIISQLKERGETNKNTAIVLADEQLLQPLLYQLPKKDITYNITMGKALQQFPIVHLIEELISIKLYQLKNQKNTSLPFSLLQSIIFSPQFRKIDTKHKLQELYEKVLDSNMTFVDYSLINEILNDTKIDFLFQPVDSLDTLIVQINQAIETIYEVNDAPLLRSPLFELRKIMNQLQAQLQQHQIDIGPNSFKALWKQVVRGTKIPFEGEPLKGLQIMGLLETRCLDFDYVIMVSTNEGVMPQGKSGNSFIPFVFKIKYEIQTVQDKDAIYAYSFYRLLHQAKETYYVYNGLPGSMGGGELSRFVQQVRAELNPRIGGKIPINFQSSSYKYSPLVSNHYEIAKDEQVLEGIMNYLRTRAVSVSALNLFIRSPLDFYFRYIVRLKEPKQFESDIEMSTLGTIVHDTLEGLYITFEGQDLTDEILQSITDNIDVELHKHISRNMGKGNVNTGKNLMYIDGAKTMIKKAIDLDKERIKQHQIKLIKMEMDLTCEIPFTINGESITIKLKGKADRIQERDGRVEIIDYKTGSVKQDKLKTSQIVKIKGNVDHAKLNQLLYYALMASRKDFDLNKISVAIQPLKSWDKGLYFLDGEENQELTDELIEQYKECLQDIFNAMTDHSKPFLPGEENNIKFSSYKTIYR